VVTVPQTVGVGQLRSFVALDAQRLLGYCYVAGVGNADW
jgi:hypothetical protein